MVSNDISLSAISSMLSNDISLSAISTDSVMFSNDIALSAISSDFCNALKRHLVECNKIRFL